MVMRVAPELPTTSGADNGAAANVKNSQSNTLQNGTNSNASLQKSAEAEAQQTQSAPETNATDLSVSFRKDPAGKIYYVLTDSQTGQVVREVPPEELRQVSEGIDDYLKAQAAAVAAAAPKTNVEA
jgi:uncharacterized FlaG/YvyC family protein